MNKTELKTFWITNFSNRNVTLSDLYISVPAMSSVNLLDRKHYSFTEEQVRKSAESGSIFKKRDKIAVRKVPPQMIPRAKIAIDPHAIIPSRTVSIYEIKQEHYEELNVGEDEDVLIEGQKLVSSENKKQEG